MNEHLLFEVTQFVLTCCSNSRKPIHLLRSTKSVICHDNCMIVSHQIKMYFKHRVSRDLALIRIGVSSLVQKGGKLIVDKCKFGNILIDNSINGAK